MAQRPKCFIIMPITTPKELTEIYKGDKDHFNHVLEHLFMPAVTGAGLEPISPISVGSDIIHAEIITNLSVCDIVLCDISILNPNVFFELGIRSALDKPAVLVRDDKTKSVPFDTSLLNFHQYNSSLSAWELKNEIDELTSHLQAVMKKSDGRNALWKYFGVSETGAFKPENTTTDEKLDHIIKLLASRDASRNIPMFEEVLNKVYGEQTDKSKLTSTSESIDVLQEQLKEAYKRFQKEK